MVEEEKMPWGDRDVWAPPSLYASSALLKKAAVPPSRLSGPKISARVKLKDKMVYTTIQKKAT